jgi:hypothetical protein
MHKFCASAFRFLLIMAQRREYIPIDVKQHIFEFIHATGNFHLFYFHDPRCIVNKPPRLTISELIIYVAYADTRY